MEQQQQQSAPQLKPALSGHQEIYKAAAQQLLRELQDFLEQETLIIQHLPDIYDYRGPKSSNNESNAGRTHYLEKFAPRVDAVVKFIHEDLEVNDKMYHQIISLNMGRETKDPSEFTTPIRMQMAWIAWHTRGL